METATIVNIALSILSFLLAAISVVTVIITLRQNREMLNNNEKQLLEMRKEHQLSVQPIIAIEDVRFQIERPRFFYTPPSDEYTFHSRYHLRLKLHNISDATAVCVDAVAYISIPNGDEKYQTMTITHREKVISAHSEVADIRLGFNGDSDAVLFEGLRGNSANVLPKVVVHLTYKNAVSGCFEVSETFLVVPKETDDEINNLGKSINIVSEKLEKTIKELALELIVETTAICDNIKGRSIFVNQLLRSCSSIGANSHEAKYAQSNADFINKLEIALKECYETEYWFEVVFKIKAIDEDTYKKLINKSGTIRRKLIASINTVKNKK